MGLKKNEGVLIHGPVAHFPMASPPVDQRQEVVQLINKYEATCRAKFYISYSNIKRKTDALMKVIETQGMPLAYQIPFIRGEIKKLEEKAAASPKTQTSRSNRMELSNAYRSFALQYLERFRVDELPDLIKLAQKPGFKTGTLADVDKEIREGFVANHPELFDKEEKVALCYAWRKNIPHINMRGLMEISQKNWGGSSLSNPPLAAQEEESVRVLEFLQNTTPGRGDLGGARRGPDMTGLDRLADVAANSAGACAEGEISTGVSRRWCPIARVWITILQQRDDSFTDLQRPLRVGRISDFPESDT